MRPHWTTFGLIMAAAGVALLAAAFGGLGLFSSDTHAMLGAAGGACSALGSAVLFFEWKDHR